MCGIVGVCNFNKKPVNEILLAGMRDVLAHRGPDGAGAYFSSDKSVALGHRRLSIIDLSERADQPMSNEDGTVWIVFNGEIYNFQELRPDLEKRGHRFKSNSDTEVIIHLYEEYGEKCLDYLRGMFAFAIWDEREQKLFLARDRVGKKPLKYFIGPDFIVFASELKVILKHPEVHKEPDLEAIYQYLTFQYVPHPMTGFVGIKKLPPATYLIIDKNGKIEEKRYWRLDYSEKLDLSEEEWKKKIMEELEEAVKLRMISDVPLGAFLSGGVDSSAIVALMSKFSTKPVKTFSIGFEEEAYNELPYARKIAKLFNTDHHEFIVKSDAIEILPKLAYHYEEPYADSSAIPTFYLAELTKKYVTVALNGDGGDENFAGYDRYNQYRLNILLDKFPNFSKTFLAIMAKLGNKILPSRFFGRAERFSLRIKKPIEEQYLSYLAAFLPELKHEIMTGKFAYFISQNASVDFLNLKFSSIPFNQNWLDRVLQLDFENYLPDDLMVKVDIASMAFGLESRSPFLDHKFLEMTAKIKPNLKMKGGYKKYIFKKALKNIIPEEILDRKKMGFGVPLDSWFRGPLYKHAKDILLSDKAIKRGFFKSFEVEKLIEEHKNNKRNHYHRLWALLFLEHWFRVYFD